jgi:HD-GYP domain-containing protein (c-di-GMP phosphodiesterase class II)
MGFRQHEVDFVRYAALLHDIGKINIKDDILKKPGKLTDEEFAIMKLHPTFGVQIMEPVKAFRQMLPYMFHHHEQFGSGGYPSGIKGEDIPIGARILTVADAFDAMTSDRPYRPGMSVEAAVAELRRNAGKQFDPAVVEAFIGWLDKSGPIDIHRVDSLFHRPDGGT